MQFEAAMDNLRPSRKSRNPQLGENGRLLFLLFLSLLTMLASSDLVPSMAMNNEDYTVTSDDEETRSPAKKFQKILTQAIPASVTILTTQFQHRFISYHQRVDLIERAASLWK